MLQFLRARVLEAEHLAALRIDAGHHVADDAILAGGVHGLENQQHGVTFGGVKALLQPVQFGDLAGEQRVVRGFGIDDLRDVRGPVLELDLFAFAHTERGYVDFHEMEDWPQFVLWLEAIRRKLSLLVMARSSLDWSAPRDHASMRLGRRVCQAR